MPVASQKKSGDSVGRSQPERWAAFGAALARALTLSGRPQRDIAAAIGVSDRTLSDWKLGKSEPERAETTFALERELNIPAGELSRHLGYVPLEAAAGSWERALGLDPEIDDRLRDAILAMIKAMKG